MRAVRRAWRRLERGWRAGLRRLPCFTQRAAVLLVGVLVASLAMLGGVVALVGWPGANGPTHLVPGEGAGQLPESRPGPGTAAPGGPEAGDRSGADAGGAAAASPSPAAAARPAPAGGAGAARGQEPSGGAAAGARGSGGAAGAGAGGPPAAPPTTPPTSTTTTRVPPGPLDPVDELLGPVVSTLLP